MKKYVILLLLLGTIFSAKSQDLSGTWTGVLNTGSGTLRLVFHLNASNGNYTATMDSPDQGATGIPVDKVQFDKGEVTLAVSAIGLTYSGKPATDAKTIDGTFTQGSFTTPMQLVYSNAETKQVRPQDPVTFPYMVEDIVFENKLAGIKLAGTLTVPTLSRTNKIVILISGSGPQNRNEELGVFNHRPFLVVSDYLTRSGIAVLRFDDRGVAQSEGNFSDATTADFATDVEAAILYIKQRPDLANFQIGLIGHSEGGLIAPMVAARNKMVNFIVLLAGPGVSGKQVLLTQIEDIMRVSKMSDTLINHTLNTSAALYNYMQKNSQMPDSLLRKNLKNVAITQISKYPTSYLSGASVDQLAEEQVDQIFNKWFRYFLEYDPYNDLKKLSCPVLALNGSTDLQVNAQINLGAIEKALKKSKSKKFQTVELPGLNHLFQKSATGLPSEYGKIEETFNAEALEKITLWIQSS